ncbi:divergent polysaccharide deacetylase family protein [Frigidibacter mobilis]|uniref:Divergent polysaccharide deacetylase n=1 Tax=Frigidibacter mobilis TaxID=1335048 RepID=A0A159Z184_9RHOB|nr:divergent polysaccharide deacetylase family protein [Frigidibacter mobilis]AMY68685.1 hypothetical protein AKL17_1431 [Frigidibacter mobilis]
MGQGRGVIFGVIWGVLASGLLLVVLSLTVPAPQGAADRPRAGMAAPEMAAPEAPADLVPALAAPQPAEEGPALPEPMPAAPDLPPGLAAAPQAPGGVGEVGTAAGTMAAPAGELPAEAAAVVADGAAPGGAPASAAVLTDAPDAAAPAPVASLIPTPYGSEFTREAPDVAPALPGIEPAPAAAPAPRPTEAAPEPQERAALDAAPAPQPPAGAAPAEPTAPASPPDSSGAVAPAPVSARPEASTPGLVPPLPQRGAEPELPAASDQPAAEQAAAAVTRPGPAPQPGFRPAPGVRVNQLPRIEDALLPGPLPGSAPPAALAPEAAALPALLAHAAAFTAAPDAPLLAIVLIDDGSGPAIAPELLADLPFPVTIALDPAAPGAADAARGYRALGQEVAILAALPRGATPSDLEVSWQAFVQALPEAVAVLDAPAGRMQNDRRLAGQLVLLAAEKGHGLLTWDIGLNPAAQLASAASVPQAKVFRRLDAEQETAPVIGRYLDRAAFEASRSGAVVVTASTRADTLAAILDWAVGQSRTVTLAPLSAVLMRDF